MPTKIGQLRTKKLTIPARLLQKLTWVMQKFASALQKNGIQEPDLSMIFWRFQTVNYRIYAVVDAASNRVYTVLGVFSAAPKSICDCEKSAVVQRNSQERQNTYNNGCRWQHCTETPIQP